MKRLIKDLSEKRRKILNIDKTSFALAMNLTVPFNLKRVRCKDFCLVPFYSIFSHHLLKLNLKLTETACLPHIFYDLGI